MSGGTAGQRETTLWRGQPRGEPLGSWWSTDREDALGHTQGAGVKDYEILKAVLPGPWADRFQIFGGVGGRGDWYNIPVRELVSQVGEVRGEVRLKIDQPSEGTEQMRPLPGSPGWFEQEKQEARELSALIWLALGDDDVSEAARDRIHQGIGKMFGSKTFTIQEAVERYTIK